MSDQEDQELKSLDMLMKQLDGEGATSRIIDAATDELQGQCPKKWEPTLIAIYLARASMQVLYFNSVSHLTPGSTITGLNNEMSNGIIQDMAEAMRRELASLDTQMKGNKV